MKIDAIWLVFRPPDKHQSSANWNLPSKKRMFTFSLLFTIVLSSVTVYADSRLRHATNKIINAEPNERTCSRCCQASKTNLTITPLLGEELHRAAKRAFLEKDVKKLLFFLSSQKHEPLTDNSTALEIKWSDYLGQHSNTVVLIPFKRIEDKIGNTTSIIIFAEERIEQICVGASALALQMDNQRKSFLSYGVDKNGNVVASAGSIWDCVTCGVGLVAVGLCAYACSGICASGWLTPLCLDCFMNCLTVGQLTAEACIRCYLWAVGQAPGPGAIRKTENSK